ncbi:MAG: hypothetical protein IT207_05875 [Fimbriimonadaceae bacterium]|nr:hypothetical protein [Fimbriimonadaceae bacterium]
MRTLAVELLLDLGASELAGIPIGDSVTYSTLSLPGVRDLKNSGPHAKAFERASIEVANRLAASAQSGELAGVNGMNWLFGSTASWLPVTGLSLTVKPWGDELWAAVVIDRGLPRPDGFMERVPLDHGSSDLATVLLPPPSDQNLVHWRPDTITRYPALSTGEPGTKGDLAKISIPEALGTSDIVSTLSIVREEPVLALLPIGFEAQISNRLKAKMTLHDALDLLGKGYFGLRQAKTEGGLILRPRNGTLGPWDAGSARASRRFVSNAREQHAYGADDLGRYFAGIGLSTLGTAEANWWETCLVREGLPARSRVAMPHDYRLLGELLRIASGGGKWKYAVLPKDIQASVRTFAFGGILSREGEDSSLLTAAESSRIKWEALTVHLAKQTVPAAVLKTSVSSVLSAATLADYLNDWQPGYPENLNPSKLRLVEGVMEVSQVKITLSEPAFIAVEFPSEFTPTHDEVQGIPSLSSSLRAEIEKHRTPSLPAKQTDGGTTSASF